MYIYIYMYIIYILIIIFSSTKRYVDLVDHMTYDSLAGLTPHGFSFDQSGWTDGQELYDQLTNACGADWQQAARRVHKETSMVEPRDRKTRSCVLRGVICRNKWYLKNHQWFLKGETRTELSSGEHS